MKTKQSILVLLLIATCTSMYAQRYWKWNTLNTGTTKNINAIYFHTPSLGYIVGEDYLFKKTTDGGNTWVDLPAPSDGEKPGNNGNIVGIDYHESFNFSQLDSGLYLTWEKGYYGITTGDEGKNYNQLTYHDTGLFCTIDGFASIPALQGNGYINLITYGQNCRGKASFYNYYDGPFSIQFTDSVNSTNSKFTAVDGDSSGVIIGDSKGYVYRYQALFGQRDSMYLDSNGVTSLGAAGRGIWFASTRSGWYNMYTSTDSGKTFSIDSTFPPTFYYPIIEDMDFLAPNYGLAVGSSNTINGVIIMKDTNSWYFQGTMYPMRSVQLLENGVAYAAGENGLMLRNGDPTSSITPIEEEKIKVYPNPSTGRLFLEGLDEVLVKVAVIDQQGRQVLELQSNSHSWDLSQLSPGAYFLDLTTQRGKRRFKILME